MQTENNTPQNFIPDNASPYQTPGYSYPSPPLVVKEPRIYSSSDSVFAFAALILGFFFVNFVLTMHSGISITLFTVTFIIFSLLWMKTNNIKQTSNSIMWILIILAQSAVFMIYDNYYIKFPLFIIMAACAVYWIYSCSGCKNGKISDNLPAELIVSHAAIPFSNFNASPEAATFHLKNNKGGKKFFLIIAGLLAAVPVCAITIGLLMDADAAFSLVWNYISKYILNDIFVYIFQFIIGIPVSFYFFGLLFGCVKNKEKALKPDFGGKLKVIPQTLIYSSATPLIAIYVLYFVSQLAYFLSAFKNTLPYGYTYAEYARRGFFELCAIASINLCIIAFMYLMTKRDAGKSKAIRIYSLLLSVFTIVLIISALSKMYMYIQTYGLTPLRVYTSWFMIILLLIFIAIILRQIFTKINCAKVITIIVISMSLIISYSNTDYLIAKYNISCYQAETLKELDIYALSELSNDGIVLLEEFTNSSNYSYKMQSKNILSQRASKYKNRDWRDFNISSLFSKELLNKYENNNTDPYSYNYTSST